MAGLVVSALLGVGAKVPASMDAPVREVFHTPPGMSAPIEPLLLYQASQDEKCRHWVDSVYNRMNLREKVGQLFIYTIAPVQTKRNMQLLRDAVHTYKVGGLLFFRRKDTESGYIDQRSATDGPLSAADYL